MTDISASPGVRQDLIRVLNALGHPNILVLGDLILDRYTWGDVPRVSPEAPVLVMRTDKRERRLGGAASVAHLLRGLEAEVTLVGVLGDDPAGKDLQQLIQQAGIESSGILMETGRVTTVKERFMGRAANRHPHQILRVDTEQKEPMRAEAGNKLLAFITERIQNYQALLISDYEKGVCRKEVLQPLFQAAQAAGVPVIVDPARLSDYSRYQGADVLTPNRQETQLAVNQQVEAVQDAFRAGESLCRRYGITSVVVTIDRDGMVLVQLDGQRRRFPTRPRRVYDITGAGDAVLSMLGIVLASGQTLAAAIELANVAAGLEVEKVGVAPISREEIRAELGGQFGMLSGKLVSAEVAAGVAEDARRRGQTVVFTNGCFDLLHAGHITYLQDASLLGDLLIVGLNSDASIRRLKGESRPVIQQEDRAAMLAALRCVDYVVVFADDTPHALLRDIRPDVLVKGGAYAPEEIVGREIVEAYGGRVCVTSVNRDVSTTQIVQRIQARAEADGTK